MRIKFLSIMLLAGAAVASAQGFKDGIDYFNAGDIEEASIILKKTINDASTDKAQANYYLGLVAMTEGKTADATNYFNAGIAANAENPFNLIGLGYVDLKNGDPKAAEKQFKEAEKFGKKDKDASVYVDIARAYFNVDPVKYAAEIDKNLQKAIKMNVYEPTIYVLQADMVAKTDPNDAAGKYESAMTYDLQEDQKIDNPEAYVKYARVYFPVNQTSRVYAINRLKELLEKHPDSAMAQRELGDKYYENNQLTLAGEQYSKYINNPNHFQKDEQRLTGLLYFAKKYQDAFDMAQRVLAQDPGNVYMERMQFLAQAAMENDAKADEYAKKFFANPKGKDQYVANDYSTYGDVLLNLKRPEEALAMYEQALKIAPDKAEYNKGISSAYAQMGDEAKSLEAFQTYISATPDPSLTDLNTMARRYMSLAASLETGTPERKAAGEKALEYINMVVDRAADKAPIYATRAQILYITNNNEFNADVIEGFKDIIAALDADPANKEKRKDTYVQAYKNLGVGYAQTKDFPNAKICFEKALEIVPDNEEIQGFLKQVK